MDHCTTNTVKRKRKQHVRPNLLFEQWISELLDEAHKKEFKSYHSYKKALSSLRKYPLPLGSGKECRILEGFGPKICDIIDEKLTNYADELCMNSIEAIQHGNNQLVTQPTLKTSNSVDQPRRKTADRSMAPKNLVRTKSLPTPNNSIQSQLHFVQTTSKTLFSDVDQKITDIVKNNKNPLGCGLQAIAACFRLPDSHSSSISFKTALDSLVDRNILSIVSSNPERYCITVNSSSSPNPTLRDVADPKASAPILPKQEPSRSSPPSPTNISSTYPLDFVFLNQKGEPVVSRADAQEKFFDDEKLPGYRIRCVYEELIMARVPYRMDWGSASSTDGDSSSVIAYLVDTQVPVRCTKAIQSVPRSVQSTCQSNSSSLQPSGLNESNEKLSSLPLVHRLSSDQTHSSVCALTKPTPPNEQQNPTTIPPSQTESAPSPELIVPGGSYRILLLADIREHFGLNRVKQLLPPVLQSLGVDCESRALPVGDFLWIARWNNEKDEVVEVVLDYVVERKRVDDLASSIVDGRFQEQKYRMKRTKLSNPILLIEECSSMRNQRIPFETLMQAVSNAQVIDEFKVMCTRSPAETVNLLVSLTSLLTSRSSFDLHIRSPSVSTNDAADSSVLYGQHWTSFVQLAVKTPVPTVRDQFAKQLIQIHGCSGQKVAAILSVYPTPRSLLEAYDRQPEAAREDMLSDLKLPTTKKSLGKALSRRIYLVYQTL